MADPHTVNESEPFASSDWSDAELSAAIEAYIKMLRSELDGEPFVKAEVNRQLREGPLAARTEGSVEFRMRNISAALYDLRIPHITGYLPAKNVGSSVKDRMRAVLQEHDLAALESYIPTADPEALAQKVKALRQHALKIVPSGSVKPGKVMTTTISFVRDPAVKRWVLEAANGVCEACDSSAPFIDKDGFPYLEVHHIMPLASHGSDRTSNAAALCPNCHRRCHFGKDREEFKLSLYEKITRLIVEVPEVDSATTAEYVDVREP